MESAPRPPSILGMSRPEIDARFDQSQWGVQGDVQYRNWNLLGDLEQLLVRGGLTWRPASNDALLTLGYASITTG